MTDKTNWLRPRGYELVAEADGRKPRDRRWTRLAIYQGGDEKLPFLAEIIGATLEEGEEQRVRRKGFASLVSALDWQRFDRESRLYDELRRKVVAWIDGRMATPAAIDPGSDRPDSFASFRAAVDWLYGTLTSCAAEQAEMFIEDWAATPETVGKFAGGFYAAGEPITVRDVIDVFDHESEYGLPAWAETFVRAMPHFKRDDFHARAREPKT